MASSTDAVLTIGLPAVIVMQPTNLAVAVGAVAAMGVVADGTAPLGYQWSVGGTNLVDATNSVLVITNVQLSDAGSYAVEVSNAFGSEQSSNTVLSVGFAPAIVAQPTDQTVWLGGSVVWAVVAEGTAPLAYQWSLGGASLADATNSALVLTNVQPRDGGSYAVVVSNAFGMASSINAVLTIGLPAMIVQQPTNLAVAVGGVAVMGIVADGTAPLAYQWSLGGTNLADATNSVLVITNVQGSDAGSYAVEVSNAFGSEQSSNATLLVYVIDHFAWDAIPSPVLVNVPFAVRIQALDASNDLVTNFTGRVVLKSTAGVSVNPSNSGDFVQGQWTGSVTISQAASGAVLTATDDSDHSGYANPIDVVSVPSLSIELAGNSVLISWPADVPAFVLESSSDYSSWAQLSIPVGLSANNYVVRVRTSGARAYYRLRFVAPPGVP
jgi:multisubunit Na+/H+ antiporter MnhC subunit